MIASINPATGETLRTFEAATAAEIDACVARADAAWHAYRRTSFAERANWLTAAAQILESDQDRLGRLMTLEMGKPIAPALFSREPTACIAVRSVCSTSGTRWWWLTRLHFPRDYKPRVSTISTWM